MTTKDFSFARHARDFDGHINASIPGYTDLMDLCVRLSGRFIQEKTTVVDIGCATGKLLTTIHQHNAGRRKDVSYLGIDLESQFQRHWRQYHHDEIRFEVDDARGLTADKPISLAISIFTLQFLRPSDKMPLLKRLYDSLTEGGAILIAEKTFASSVRLQDALTFTYYDAKLKNGFSSKQVLDKERSLRGQMTLWEGAELESNLSEAGFTEFQCIWGHFPFFCYLAVKR